MRHPLRSLSALTIVLLVAGCAGGGSSEEYFADLEKVTGTLDAELDDLEAGVNEGLLDIDFESADAEHELITLFRTSLTGTAASFAQLVAGLRDIVPPAAAALPHAEALQAGERVLAGYQEREDQLESLDTLADVDAYAAALSAEGFRQRFSEACRELQIIADQDNIDVNLGCS